MRRWRHEPAGGRKRGQVVVEVLLVLPVFLWLVFTIMEIGHLAFRTILIHHAAYEVARYGSLTCPNTFIPRQGCEEPKPDEAAMRSVARRILPKLQDMDVKTVATIYDRQAQCQAYDIVVTLKQDVPMVFPMTGVWLADKGRKTRRIAAAVPMPVERPLFH